MTVTLDDGAVVAVAFVAAGLIKGLLGVGLPLVSVPIASLVLPPAKAIALGIVPILVSNIWQALESGGWHRTVGRFWPLALGLMIGVAIGGHLLSRLSGGAALIILGSLLIAFCGYQLVMPRWSVSPQTERWLGPVVGLTAGVTGGVSSFFGPILISYMLGLHLTKDEFVGSIALLYLICMLSLGTVLKVNHVLTSATLLGSVLVLAPLFFGMFAGRRMRARLPTSAFRWLLVVLLLVIGVVTVSRGFAA